MGWGNGRSAAGGVAVILGGVNVALSAKAARRAGISQRQFPAKSYR